MRSAKLLLVLGIGVALVACEQVAEPIPDELQPQLSMAAGRVVESVSGSAHFTSGRTGAELWRTSSFNARMYADGSVEGTYQAKSHGGNFFKGVITCFSVQDNAAWLGVIVEKSSLAFAIGSERVFYVEDNGEGANALPDRSTLLPRLLFFLPNKTLDEFCQAQPDMTPLLHEIEAGNIQIMP